MDAAKELSQPVSYAEGRTQRHGFDHLVYLRIFSGCNVYCDHCFIPSKPGKMRLDDLLAVPDILENQAGIPHGSRVLLQWHGGEPTAMPASMVSEAITTLDSDGRYEFMHGIQTNLTLLTDEWLELFLGPFREQFGISWDPFRKMRSTMSEDEFNQVFWPNLERIVEAGLDPHLTVTVTRPLVGQYPGSSLYELFLEKGVRFFHLERLTKTGIAREHWGDIGLSNAEHSAAMVRYLVAYRGLRANGAFLAVSPFDELFESVERLVTGTSNDGGIAHACHTGSCDTRFHTIDHRGYQAACTALTSEDEHSIAGHGGASQVEEVRVSLATLRSGRRDICSSCTYRAVCSSGCLATSQDDGSGECAGGRRLFEAVASMQGP